MNDYEHTPQTIEQPIAHPERQPGAHADRSGHKLRRTIAAVALVAGGGIVGHEIGVQQADRPDISHAQEGVSGISNRVELDLTVAAEVDTCETKVKAQDAVEIYRRIFLAKEPTELKPLEDKVDDIVKDVQVNVKKSPLASLTSDQKQFITNANAHQLVGEYADYKKVLSDYLNQFDIKLVDRWTDGSKVERQMHKAGIDQTTQPLSPQELHDNDSAKVQIINILNGMSMLPKELIKESGVHTIFLADSKDNTYDGIAYSDKGTLGFDIHQDTTHQSLNAYSLHNMDVAPHEFMHAYDYALCNGFVGSYINDPGFESLNRAFKYGEDVRTKLEQGEAIDSTYTTLQHTFPGSEIVVTSPYGATNANEDKATLFGENILFPSRISGLMAESKGDATVLQEKIAYLLARISAKNPAVGEYYISMLEAAQLAVQVSKQTIPYQDAMADYVQKHQDEVSNFSFDNGYNKLLKKTEPYTKLQSKIYSLIDSGGLFTSEESYGMK